LDLWFNGSTENLATIFPALFSHTLRPAATVARVLGYPALNLDLAPRLTHDAEHELGNLRDMLASVSMNLQVMDKRTGRFDGKPMTCKSAYKVVWINKPIDPFATTIWKNYAPNKCRIFLWLAHKNRLFTNERRFK
uniref:Reverse transcriptase zinc-binding domain-containing protein n=1 Tax=Aegilops tauschii subsp. strangulata TaxID=200361 RepID=A0A453A437_AEGTS